MKVLFVGDIYGQKGLDTLKYFLPQIKEEYKPNIIIVNGENVTHGRGINKRDYKQLMNMGIHMVTMGNWVWGNRELYEFIDDANIVRPLNFYQAPGQGYKIISYNQEKILVINALGRTFMNGNIENPFIEVKKVLEEVECDYSIVDFHAEATSEKVALGFYLDGLASAVVGTHTHVPTADSRTLPKGTLYITDVGLTGPLDGIIGVDREIVINRFLNGHSVPNVVAEGAAQFNGVLLDFDIKKIKHIHLESETV
ncbi:MAG: TIGR00282 family metallophosphoesterase [Acholeplasmataceae bacterium]